jgi:ubiquinone/menaquinone biosynthesis C-methylase UbiE
MDDPATHWQTIYTSKRSGELSWFQEHPRRSIELIQRTGVDRSASILDVGGGDSTLVDDLITMGYEAITVLDVSGAALSRARARLGELAERVSWKEGNILTAELPRRSVDVWHDRAAFHFLTTTDQRSMYVAQVERIVRPGGHVIMATFAEDGPSRCSGLPVARYSATQLHDVFGDAFALVQSQRDTHVTPAGVEQNFTYCWFRYAPAGVAGNT